jgi:hypothetical protein
MRSTRLYAALLLLGLFAFRALPTDAESGGGYTLFGIGGGACARLSTEHAATASLSYGFWPMGPVGVLCNLDRVLLSLHDYYSSDPFSVDERLLGRLHPRSGR